MHEDLLAEHNAFRASVGVEPCPPDEFNTASPWLDLYEFPRAADYRRAQPLGSDVAPARILGARRASRRSTWPSTCPATARSSTSRSALSAAWTWG